MLLSGVSAPLPSALIGGTPRTDSGSATAGCSAASLPSDLIRGGARTSSGDHGVVYATVSGGHSWVVSTATLGAVSLPVRLPWLPFPELRGLPGQTALRGLPGYHQQLKGFWNRE
ncbi:hypothetical protein HN873_043053 [Arachis hypogaea]